MEKKCYFDVSTGFEEGRFLIGEGEREREFRMLG